ncbi:hypothetical protein [Neobacillus sp. PS3-40]|uniref:hypothetical protein n=1 Tax=Neobacillus sp. PS3-40 TaxID=3070679 RepID=UPI0027DEC71A|nr:hypothetical protein [Neobacillus sp. PS3-40]WML43135.1 hypothetical protein RCG20_15170 [Neobacillus sp. PS3-40]
MSIFALDIAEQVYTCKVCPHANTFERIYYQQRSTPHIAFILQNPGSPNKKDKEQLDKIKNESSEFKASFHTKGLKNWLLDNGKGNTEYFYKFFRLLYKSKLIETAISEIDDFRDYVNNDNLFNDVYFTDAVKCVGKTKDMDKLVDVFDNCVNSYLVKEFSLLENLEYIFVFSTRGWNAFRNIFNEYECVSNPSLDNFTVAQSHGYVFNVNISNEHERIVKAIPLTHMSKTNRNNTLRDSYFDYLEEGLNYIYSLNQTAK